MALPRGDDLVRAIEAELESGALANAMDVAAPVDYGRLIHSPEQRARARWLIAPDLFRSDARVVTQRTERTRYEVGALRAPHPWLST